jgi:hypothetical protein
MTEDDIAYLYPDILLQETIEATMRERRFWHDMAVAFSSSESLPYYTSQFAKYDKRVVELMALQKEKFGE